MPHELLPCFCYDGIHNSECPQHGSPQGLSKEDQEQLTKARERLADTENQLKSELAMARLLKRPEPTAQESAGNVHLQAEREAKEAAIDLLRGYHMLVIDMVNASNSEDLDEISKAAKRLGDYATKIQPAIE